jgi:esterase/lipase superfamily enzyme
MMIAKKLGKEQVQIPGEKHRGGLASVVRLLAALPILGLFLLSGCSKTPVDRVLLMPAPGVFAPEGGLSPFADSIDVDEMPYTGMLYATDRRPAGKGDRARFYSNDRGNMLRVGIADISSRSGDITTERAREISLLKNRPGRYELEVTGIEEFGALQHGLGPFQVRPETAQGDSDPGRRFAEIIDRKLEQSRKKDIYVYVHGYKVVFENPVLVAYELWNFLGYEGVFIAYSWPATPKGTAYTSDLETAGLSSRALRIFLQYLAEETSAESIHILGYSAGTRVVAGALNQLALLGRNKPGFKEEMRIGEAILVGSDIDTQYLGAMMVDNMPEICHQLSIYSSRYDRALGVSRWLFNRERAGQLQQEQLSPEATEYLKSVDNPVLIDASEAADSRVGNGHGYFLNSPWVSSDVLATLLYGLAPSERGLIRPEDKVIWSFPPDYISRLRSALLEVDPSLSVGASAPEHDE